MFSKTDLIVSKHCFCSFPHTNIDFFSRVKRLSGSAIVAWFGIYLALKFTRPAMIFSYCFFYNKLNIRKAITLKQRKWRWNLKEIKFELFRYCLAISVCILKWQIINFLISQKDNYWIMLERWLHRQWKLIELSLKCAAIQHISVT